MMHYALKYLFMMVLACTSILGWAENDEFLPASEAFQVNANGDGSLIHFQFEVAEGYYLYKHRFAFEVTEGAMGTLGEPIFKQQGKWKQDAVFGNVEVFYTSVDIYVPVLKSDGGFIEVDARYQGCADKGLCYIPQTYTNMFQVDENAPRPPLDLEPTASQANSKVQDPVKQSTDLDTSSAASLQGFLSSSNLISILGLFFIIGVGLTFTPCVLPMIPILSGIIVGQGSDLSRTRAAALSLTYVLGMALTYAALGVAAGLTGAKLQVAMQNPLVLFSFAAIFAVLSLSMFGFYELQLPSALQNKLNQVSQNQRGGTYVGVAIIGILSALVVSPCVSAPLAGALLYIGKSGDWILGGSALLALGLGMGAPLMAIGITGANFLPKAGGWMDNVKGLFGVMLLAVALWLIKHLLPATLAWIAAGGLLIMAGIYLGALDSLTSPRGKLFKALGITLMVCGSGIILNSTIDNGPSMELAATPETTPFERLRSETQLDQLLNTAKATQQPVIVDFYADWCTACLEMEHETFTHPEVKQRLARHKWIQIDLTNNPEDQALLSRFNLPGPPAILFFSPQGDEIKDARIYAYKTRPQFLEHLSTHKI